MPSDQVRMANAEGRTLILERGPDAITARFFDADGEPTGETPWQRSNRSLNDLIERYERLDWWMTDPYL